MFSPKASKFYGHTDVARLLSLKMGEGPKHNLLGFFFFFFLFVCGLYLCKLGRRDQREKGECMLCFSLLKQQIRRGWVLL